MMVSSLSEGISSHNPSTTPFHYSRHHSVDKLHKERGRMKQIGRNQSTIFTFYLFILYWPVWAGFIQLRYLGSMDRIPANMISHDAGASSIVPRYLLFQFLYPPHNEKTEKKKGTHSREIEPVLEHHFQRKDRRFNHQISEVP